MAAARRSPKGRAQSLSTIYRCRWPIPWHKGALLCLCGIVCPPRTRLRKGWMCTKMVRNGYTAKAKCCTLNSCVRPFNHTALALRTSDHHAATPRPATPQQEHCLARRQHYATRYHVKGVITKHGPSHRTVQHGGMTRAAMQGTSSGITSLAHRLHHSPLNI